MSTGPCWRTSTATTLVSVGFLWQWARLGGDFDSLQDIWQHLETFLSQLEARVLLASGGWRLEMLLRILQCPGQPCVAENYVPHMLVVTRIKVLVYGPSSLPTEALRYNSGRRDRLLSTYFVPSSALTTFLCISFLYPCSSAMRPVRSLGCLIAHAALQSAVSREPRAWLLEN